MELPSLPSPNHGERRGGARPSLIVIHYTGMEDGPSARARLCDPEAEVSAHWLIHEGGAVEALVPEERRAWHAGAGSWRGQDDVNSRSIGIELVNPGDRPFAAAQMDALELLLGAIMARWSIAPVGVIGHSDMAPGRKIDPGPRFDWARLARQGLAIHPAALGEDCPLAASLTAIGYPETDSESRLAAFRLRFRPGAEGPEDETDRRLAAAAADLFASMSGWDQPGFVWLTIADKFHLRSCNRLVVLPDFAVTDELSLPQTCDGHVQTQLGTRIPCRIRLELAHFSFAERRTHESDWRVVICLEGLEPADIQPGDILMVNDQRIARALKAPDQLSGSGN